MKGKDARPKKPEDHQRSFFAACALLGIVDGAQEITNLEDNTTIQHSIYGQIHYDFQTGKVRVQHGDLAERLRWLYKPKNARLIDELLRWDSGYYPNAFLRLLRALGISAGIKKVTTEDEPNYPPNTVF